jgi:hypothetical protein
MAWSSWFIFGGYMVLFGALVAGVLVLRLRRRHERKPFPDHLRLRRGPGESLRRQVERLDDAMLNRFALAFLLPLLASGGLLLVTTHLADHRQWIGLGTLLAGLLAGLVLLGRSLAAQLDEWRNRYLGYFGERVVAEALEPLKAQGYHVFHDVPANDGRAPFNLDHVVVGPTGIFAIETKTRRQGSARDGFASHEIIYDGDRLSYPWGTDQHGLAPARERAAWLARWLETELEIPVPVQPMLTFPGWTVITRQPGPVTVVSPAQLPAAITAAARTTLGPPHLAAVIKRLDVQCRDVEF